MDSSLWVWSYIIIFLIGSAHFWRLLLLVFSLLIFRRISLGVGNRKHRRTGRRHLQPDFGKRILNSKMEVDPSRLIAAEGSLNRDFISELPEPILLHILSFLPIKDVVRTSILSKTWKNIWTTLPYLNLSIDFMEEFYPYCSMGENNMINRRFLKAVDKIIFNRCKQQIRSIEKFHIFIPPTEIARSRKRFQTKLNRWISYMSHIKELYLRGSSYRDIQYLDVPSTILSAKSISVLSLFGFDLMPLSNSDIKFTSLRTMHLSHVILDDNIMRRLILGCPLLGELSLVFCSDLNSIYVTGLSKLKRLTVSENDDLEKLEIDSPGIHDLYISTPLSKCKVNIASCACLRKVQLYGDFITGQWLCHFVSRCSLIEVLDIGYSKALENVKITTNTLKVLKLNSSLDTLVDVEIHAPRLEKFHFILKRSCLTGFPTCSLNASHVLEVLLDLDLFSVEDLCYDQLTKFLGNFNHFRTIKLLGSFGQDFYSEGKERQFSISTLYNEAFGAPRVG